MTKNKKSLVGWMWKYSKKLQFRRLGLYKVKPSKYFKKVRIIIEEV